MTLIARCVQYRCGYRETKFGITLAVVKLFYKCIQRHVAIVLHLPSNSCSTGLRTIGTSGAFVTASMPGFVPPSDSLLPLWVTARRLYMDIFKQN